MLKCADCGTSATHVLVDYDHNAVDLNGQRLNQNGRHGKQEITYCSRHAFDDGRQECPCCDQYDIEVEDLESSRIMLLLPTYYPDTLDVEGCCSEHP